MVLGDESPARCKSRMRRSAAIGAEAWPRAAARGLVQVRLGAVLVLLAAALYAGCSQPPPPPNLPYPEFEPPTAARTEASAQDAQGSEQPCEQDLEQGAGQGSEQGHEQGLKEDAAAPGVGTGPNAAPDAGAAEPDGGDAPKLGEGDNPTTR